MTNGEASQVWMMRAGHKPTHRQRSRIGVVVPGDCHPMAVSFGKKRSGVEIIKQKRVGGEDERQASRFLCTAPSKPR